MLPMLGGKQSSLSLANPNPNSAPALPILGFFNVGQSQPMPFPVPMHWQPWTTNALPLPLPPQCLVQGRPILGRRNEPNHIQEELAPTNGNAGIVLNLVNKLVYVAGAGESDKGVKRIWRPPSPTNADNWPANNNNNDIQVGVNINTAVPPPPIVPPPPPPQQQQQRAKENEYCFRPIQQQGVGGGGGPCNPVELHVTNLDQSIDLREIKKLLMAAFREHVMVLHVSVFVQSDGSAAASVKVPSAQDAQYAISQLHRRKVGFKRIMISYGHSNAHAAQNPQVVKNQIVSLLAEVPGHKMPLFTFRDLFASRFLASVSVSDLYRMRDVCRITEENNGRTIALNRSTPSPDPTSAPSPTASPEPPFCSLHSTQLGSNDKGWAEQDQPAVVNVRVRLADLSDRVTSLVRSHNNRLPLASLPDCYAAQFEPLEIVESGGAQGGAVPLEHLVTCISGVELVHSGGSKALRLCPPKPALDNKSDESIVLSVSPSLASQVQLFARELVDLLKTQPGCQLQFNRFIPAYHHHFGRQCRVADYGFTKLVDLLETLPHVVQVIGDGSKRLVTLSHRAQVRRFTSDLLRVLKAQASKQMVSSDLPQLFERSLGRPFEAADYGLCQLGDLLSQLPPNVVLVTPTPDDSAALIAIPKREQTPDEVEHTKQFAVQVVELLSLAPQCCMEFAKFIPAYHHHFGTQCRVSDFGFTKLIELFEAIPHVVKVEDEGEGDRKVSLTLSEKLKVLANQMWELVTPRFPPGLPVDKINSVYLWQFGYGLRPSAYGCTTINQLLDKLPNIKVVESGENGWVIVPAGELLVLRSLRILWTQFNGRLTLYQFFNAYLQHFNTSCTTKQLNSPEMHGVLQVCGDNVQLSPLQLFGRDVYHVVSGGVGGRLPLPAFQASFLHLVGSLPCPAQFGQPDMLALLHAIHHVVTVEEIMGTPVPVPKGVHQKSVVVHLPDPRTPPSVEQCMLMLMSPAKFLLPPTATPTAPDPSALPRPSHFNLTQPPATAAKPL